MTGEIDERRLMRAYHPGQPLVFNHIPKTAGTSLHAALVAALAPSRVVRGVDLSLAGSWWKAGTSTIGTHVWTSPDQLPLDADLVSGHISPATTMERYPGADHMTMLRDPRLRILSHWLHTRSLSDFDLRHMRGEAADAFRAGRQPLRDLLRTRSVAPAVDNAITRFLAWPHTALEPDGFIDTADDDAVLDAALRRLDSFAHVGVVEDAEATARLGAWLGRDLPDVRTNDRSAHPPRLRTDLELELDDRAMDLIAERTRLDLQVWRHVAERVLPDQDLGRILAQSWDRAIERYRTVLDQRPPRRPVRRAAEVVYTAGRRLRR